MNFNGHVIDRDLRAARELLRWSQTDLSEKSKVGVATIRRFETGVAISDERREKLVAALVKAGIVFFGRLEIEGVEIGRGVALRPRARPKKAPKKRVYTKAKDKTVPTPEA